jgi:hypothetical protein
MLMLNRCVCVCRRLPNLVSDVKFFWTVTFELAVMDSTPSFECAVVDTFSDGPFNVALLSR